MSPPPQGEQRALLHKYLVIRPLIDCWPQEAPVLSHPRALAVVASLRLMSSHSEGLTSADGAEFLTWKICSLLAFLLCV